MVSSAYLTVVTTTKGCFQLYGYSVALWQREKENIVKGFCIMTTSACLSPDKCFKYFDPSDCCENNTSSFNIQIHDQDAPWKTYLVVLEGNVEDKKPKTPTKGKTEKAEAGKKKSTARKSDGGDAAAGTGTAGDPGKTHTDSIVVSAEPVTLPSEWTSHGAIALVSHSALGGITVIHTEVPPGTQIQPIVTTDSTGTSVISLDGSAIPVPFSIPVSMAHTIPLSSESITVSVPAISVPVSDGTLPLVSETPTVSTSSVLEAAASQTILAPVSETKPISETDISEPNIQTVVVSE